LLGGFILTIIVGYILVFYFPDIPNLSIWIIWLIFMVFQQKQVKKWSEENPDKKYKSWFKALAWGLLWLAFLYLIFFIIALFSVFNTWNIEKNISIIKEYPREVSVWDTFNIKFSIKNIDSTSHNLNTIDISNSLLKWLNISDINPKNLDDFDDWFWSHTYNFKENLSNTSETSILLKVKAIKKWDFVWNVDFCIDLDTSCIYDSVNILVK